MEGTLAPTPSWQAADEDGPYEGNTLDVGDVDGDGRLDLVVSDNDQLGGVGEVRLWCGVDWVLCHAVPQRYASAVDLFDWDGDGDLDLFIGKSGGLGPTDDGPVPYLVFSKRF